MKICLVLGFAVLIFYSAIPLSSSQKTFYVPDTRYPSLVPQGASYPRVRGGRSMILPSQNGLETRRYGVPQTAQMSDPFDPTYSLGVYPLAKPQGELYAGFTLKQNQRIPTQTLQGVPYGTGQAGYPQPQGVYNLPAQPRVWQQESPYPSFQAFEDQYPAFNPVMQTKQGHPYHSQRIRIKHSFPAERHVDPPSPQLNQYLTEYGDTPQLNRVLPHFGGFNRHLAGGSLAGMQQQLGHFGSLNQQPLGQYGTIGQSFSGQIWKREPSNGANWKREPSNGANRKRKPSNGAIWEQLDPV
ncbi:hypothetical protein WDU94_013607 [Cyamophila willieti]